MLVILVILLMVAGAGFMLQEGVFSAAIILVCTVLGGLIAFNFYEPVAGVLGQYASFMGRYTEFITLMILFAVATTALRLISEWAAPTMVKLPDIVHRGGGVVIGLWLGWICAGIIICALQTLPLHKNFMGYDYRLEKTSSNGFNADRRWLAFVQRVSSKVFEHQPARSFDPQASFVIKYHALRLDDAGVAGVAPATSDTSRAPRSGRRSRGRRGN